MLHIPLRDSKASQIIFLIIYVIMIEPSGVCVCLLVPVCDLL